MAVLADAGWIWVVQQRLSGDVTRAIGGAYAGIAIAVLQALLLLPLLNPAEARGVRRFAAVHLACTGLLFVMALTEPR
jgi:hypothetical protein